MENKMEILLNGGQVNIELSQSRIRPRVACLGPEGTYTEAARHNLLGKHLALMEAGFLPRNGDVVQQVASGDYDLGIVPVENAIEGDVVEVLRELNHARDITILGETIIGIQHMLLGQEGSSIKTIYSHPQALAQCRSYLLENYPGVKQKAESSTTAAAEKARDEENSLAIASRRAAEVYGLPILAEDIGDVKGNSTRFLMLGRGEANPTGSDSTSLIFVPTSDRPGILARCLTALASYGLNLTKLDSRPTGKLREYAFWVTLDGHYKDETVRRGIDDLRDTYCASLRILGSYQKAVLPQGIKDPGSINNNH